MRIDISPLPGAQGAGDRAEAARNAEGHRREGARRDQAVGQRRATNPAHFRVSSPSREGRHKSAKACTQMLHAVGQSRCHIVPSPLWGGTGEGYNTHCLCLVSPIQQCRQPTIAEVRGQRPSLRSLRCFKLRSPPLSLVPPPQGGGNRGARTFATRARCPRIDFRRFLFPWHFREHDGIAASNFAAERYAQPIHALATVGRFIRQPRN